MVLRLQECKWVISILKYELAITRARPQDYTILLQNGAVNRQAFQSG